MKPSTISQAPSRPSGRSRVKRGPVGRSRLHPCWILCLLIGTAAIPNAATAEAGTCQPRPLNILLTNDDGYDTPGIVALHRALASAGHHVKRIAPAENQSGSSASLSFRDVTVTRVPDETFRDVYAVAATPATTVVLGATALFTAEAPLDLVVSGINEGANLGPATPISGTVGAVIAALRILQPQVPGIAVSTDLLNESPRAPENLQLASRISSFVARLVETLQTRNCGTGRILPENTALNVNYPPLAPTEIKGVRMATQGRAPYFRISFQALEGGVYIPAFGAPEARDEAPDADTRLFRDGYVTIVPIDGDYTANPSPTQLGTLEMLVP